MLVVSLISQGDKVTVLEVLVEDAEDSEPACRVMRDETVSLTQGERGVAYRRLQEYLVTQLRESAPDLVIVKASAVSGRGSATLSLLHSAELRGVVQAAVAEASCILRVVRKAEVSRKHGDRKADGYIKDDEYWLGRVEGELRKGSRENLLNVLYCLDNP